MLRDIALEELKRYQGPFLTLAEGGMVPQRMKLQMPRPMHCQ